MRSDGVIIARSFPRVGAGLRFSLQWRGRRLKIKIDQTKQRLDALWKKESR